MCLVLLGCGLGLTAPAQFTSSYSGVTVAGTFNSYDSTTVRMRLISNGVWQGYIGMTNPVPPSFYFAADQTARVWRSAGQTNFHLPLSGTAVLDAGVEWVISNQPSGVLRFRLDEQSGAYQVSWVASAVDGPAVWVNELHYDHVGSDTNEGFEIAGVAGLELTNFVLLLYNGASGTTNYQTNLAGVVDDEGGGSGALWFSSPANAFQNGSPDGLALVRRHPSNVVSFLSYEGVMVAIGGPADGMTSVDIGVAEDNTVPVGYSLQVVGEGDPRVDMTWRGPTNDSRGSLNVGQAVVLPGPTAIVAVSNVVTVPGQPLSNTPVQIQADIASVAASNLSVTLFYRTAPAAPYVPVVMTNDGTRFVTATAIPPQSAGAAVDYFVFVNFDGFGTNSPVVSPQPAARYTIPLLNPGSVWINELNADGDANGQETNEFIELAGLAGLDLSGWRVECYDRFTNCYASYALPFASVLGNDAGGFGFFVLGDATVPGCGVVFTNAPTGFEQLADRGVLRLLDSAGAVVQALRYGAGLSEFTAFPTDPIGEEPAGFLDDPTLALVGTGSNGSAFAWTTNTTYGGSPGQANAGQLLSDGNTNPIPPLVLCPPALWFNCTNDLIPPPDPGSVVVTGHCALGAVVTHVGDVTNGGTGCLGSPRIITRTYQAVSSCGVTATCAQLISTENLTSPVLTITAPVLTNGGFEAGSLQGWTVSTAAMAAVEVSPAQPRSGSFHAVIRGPVSTHLQDSSALAWPGGYSNSPAWGQPGATTSTVKSVRFDGVNDRADIPWHAAQNAASFSFALWVKPTGGQGTARTALSAREITWARGFALVAGSTNKWEFWTGASNFWSVLATTAAVTTGQWVHLVAAYDDTTRVKTIYLNGVLAASSVETRYVTNALYPLRIGAGAPETVAGSFFFPGFIDDVQAYGYALSSTQVASLYALGQGGVVATGAVGHYRMDDDPGALVRTVTVSQVQSAATGQLWQAIAWLANSAADPMRNGNTAAAELQFLNAGGTAVATYVLGQLTAASPTGVYQRLLLRQTAPPGTDRAALRIVYVQDDVYSPGSVLLDDLALTPLVFTNEITDFRPFVTASGACGPVTLTQSPAPGTTVCGNPLVVFTASDGCGPAGQCSLNVEAVDSIAPLFTSSVATANYGCLADVPPPNTNAAQARVWDNCGTPVVRLETNLVSTSGGCGSASKSIVYRWRVTDVAGNFAFQNELIQVRDSNAPVVFMPSPPALTNAGFEAGTLAGWEAAGAPPSVLSDSNLARSGTAFLTFAAGLTGRVQQLLAAGTGQTWRGAAQVRAGSAVATNGLEVRVEFLDVGLQCVGGATAVWSAVHAAAGTYVSLAASALSPPGSAYVRLAVHGEPPPGTTNTAGVLLVDDLDLGRATVSTSAGLCTAPAPDVRSLVIASDCQLASVTQSPAPGTALTLGLTSLVVIAVDACGYTNTLGIPVIVRDELPPIITSGPADLWVASTNAIPAPDTNLVVATDACQALVPIMFAGETNNGATGLLGDPLVLVRRYLATDASGNTALHLHTITVEEAPVSPYDQWAQSIPSPALRGDREDADGDAALNLFEYSQGTDPTNANDHARVHLVRSNGQVFLIFNRVNAATDLIYEVQGAEGPANGALWRGLATNLAGSWGPATNVLDDNTAAIHRVWVHDDAGATNRALRLRIIRP